MLIFLVISDVNEAEVLVEEFKIEMINTTSDSNSSPNPASWICKGTNASPHPEIENWGDSCMFPSCKNTKEDSSKVSVTQTSGNVKKLGSFWIIALILIAFLGGAAYFTYSLWQKFKPCPEGQKKQQGICLAIIDSPTSAPKNTTNNQSIALNLDWISNSDRVLFKGSSNKDRDLGIEAFKQGKFCRCD